MRREYSFANEKADYLNGYVRKFIGGLESMKIEFVTDSKYETIKWKFEDILLILYWYAW